MTARQSTRPSTGVTQRDAATRSSILVVDPDSDTRALYVAGLELAGWMADSASDGREALAKAISMRPAAIVTETRVPRLDGFELCRLLRSDPDTLHIPILVVTGDAEQSRIFAAEKAGADRVLIKPCLPDELARAVEAVLGTMRDKQYPRVAAADDVSAEPTTQPRSQTRRYQRGETTSPPSRPPELVCPRCDQRLEYRKSYVGGVSAKHGEQWDTYRCPSGCGQFQYRQRTRKLRDVS
jgi:CheY-like chemotaxis protein